MSKHGLMSTIMLFFTVAVQIVLYYDSNCCIDAITQNTPSHYTLGMLDCDISCPRECTGTLVRKINFLLFSSVVCYG